MSKFKVGDVVEVIESGHGCGPKWNGLIVTITDIGEYNDGLGYRVDPPIGNTLSGSFDGYIGERTFKLVEKGGTMNTKDLYTHKHDGTIVCGDTAIKTAKRKRDGEQQYIIAYEHSKVMNGAVKHSDIPALIAALLDVYDGDVKDKEEEIPF